MELYITHWIKKLINIEIEKVFYKFARNKSTKGKEKSWRQKKEFRRNNWKYF